MNNSEEVPKWEPSSNRSNPQPVYGEALNLKRPAFDYFPQELIDLRLEIQKHPALLIILADQADKDVYIQILEIAAYCKILVMGEYTRDDMLGLCEKLTQKLRSMRKIVVISSST